MVFVPQGRQKRRGEFLRLSAVGVAVAEMQAANRAKVEQAAAAAGYGDMVYHTWAGWRALGREVVHTEKCVFQVVIEDPTTAKGARVTSYFIREQTFEPLAI